MQMQQKNDINISDFGPQCTEVVLDLHKLYSKYNGKLDGGVLIAAYLFFGVAIATEWQSSTKTQFKALSLYKKISLRIIMWLYVVFSEALKVRQEK